MPWCGREHASSADACSDPGLRARHLGQPPRGAVREDDRCFEPVLRRTVALPHRIFLVQHTRAEKQRTRTPRWHKESERFSRDAGSVGCFWVVLSLRGLLGTIGGLVSALMAPRGGATVFPDAAIDSYKQLGTIGTISVSRAAHTCPCAAADHAPFAREGNSSCHNH